MKITKCRICNGRLNRIISLGSIPIVNRFLSISTLKKEVRYPLHLCYCVNCGFIQLDFVISPSHLFSTYQYKSGASLPLVNHLHQIAKECIKIAKSDTKKWALDIGSNDGTLVSALRKQKIEAVGIEPAKNITSQALQNGIPTINAFFTLQQAQKIQRKYGEFDLVTIIHCLANIENLNDFMEGLKIVLKPEGIVVIEVGDADVMLANGTFDSIYHEHYSYFSKETLSFLLKKHGFEIIKLEKNSFHGGSIRAVARKLPIFNSQFSNKLQFLNFQTKRNYSYFVKKVLQNKKKLRKTFQKLKGKKIAGYGAPAKAVTLINYCKLEKYISYIVDSTPEKQETTLPGTHIPIHSEEHMKDHRIDCIVILAWNYHGEIIEKLRRLPTMKEQLRVLVPFPTLRITSL